MARFIRIFYGGRRLTREEIPLYRAWRGERFRNLELRVRTESGGARIVLASGEPLVDANGNRLGAVVSTHDVTEEREAVSKLRESEDLYRTVVKAMFEGVVVQDGRGSIRAYNESALRILGLSVDQLLGRTSMDLAYRTRREDGSGFPGEEHPAMVALRTGEAQRNVTMQAHKADGSVSWILINAEPVKKPDGLSVVTTFVDITETKKAEEALRHREQDLREAQRLARVGSWSADSKGGELVWSDEMYRITGRDPALGPFALDQRRALFDEESNARLDAARQRLMVNGARFELDMRMADGMRWLSITGEAQRDDCGQVTRLRGTVQDITERKQAEEKLQAYAAELDDLYNHAPCGYHSVDENGVIVRMNDTQLAMLGYDRDEVEGKMSVADFGVDFRREKFAERIAVLKSVGWVGDMELDLRRKDGSVLPVIAHSTAMTDANGKFVRSRTTVLDVTERKKAESLLRAAENRFRFFVERNPMGAVRNRLDGTILECNDSFARMLGFDSANELAGRKTTEFHYNTVARQGMIDKLKRDKIVLNYEAPVRRRDGTEIWTSENIALVEDADTRYIEGTIIEITQRKRAEEALRNSLAEKEVLLKEIHHRVKNNLQVVCSLLRMQGNATDSETAKELLQESENRVYSMAAIHENMYQAADFAHVDLSTYLRRVAEGVTETFQDPKVSCGIEIEAGTDVTMQTAIPCGLIVNELITNAMKHSFGGGPGRIVAGVRREGPRLVVFVEDNGKGLPEGYTLGSGGGLGMQLVLALTRQLGGVARTVPAPGAKFEIEFEPE